MRISNYEILMVLVTTIVEKILWDRTGTYNSNNFFTCHA
jgi:hypothetical protein